MKDFEDNKINIEEVDKHLSDSHKKAEKILKDKDKTITVLGKVKVKIEKYKKALSEIWIKLKLMVGITKDWIMGNYRVVPFKSILAIMSGLLYLISPVDLIPDILPGGLLDDIFIIKIILDKVSDDLDKYREWKEANSAEVAEKL